MSKLIFYLALIILVVSCNSKSDYSKADLILQDIKLFDGDKVYNKATIVIDNGIILKLFTDLKTSFSGKNVIQGNGLTVVPGLINSHVHMHSQTFKVAENAAKNGILTLMDLGGIDYPFLDSLQTMGNTMSSMPYFYSSKNHVTVENGHGTQYAPYQTVNNVSEIPAFIKQRKSEGSDYIKIIIERGSPERPRETLTDEMIEAAIKNAHEEELLTVAHISRRSDALIASKAGVDGLAHFWSKNFRDDISNIDTTKITDQELYVFKENKIFIIPTIILWEKPFRSNNSFINLKSMKEEIGKVYNTGIPILAGTDSPVLGINPGKDLYLELEYLSECGIPHIDVLKTATSNPSKAFNLGDKGYIKESASADLLLIGGDPTSNIKDINNIIGVWKQGVRINHKVRN